MIATAQQLMQELAARGLAPEGAGLAPQAAGRPWYIGLILGIAGWVAGLFILLILFLILKPNAAGTALVLGILLIGVAWGLYRLDREGAFVSQLALALSIAGQFAVVGGIAESFFRTSQGIAGISLVAFVLQAALVFAMPNRLHRTMSTLFACVAWALLVRYGLWDNSGSGFGSGASRASSSLALALAGWALAWLPVAGLLYYLALKEATWMAAGHAEILRPAAAGFIVSLAVGTLLSQPFESFTWVFGSGARMGWLAIWPLLSALAALGGLVAAYALGSRGLTATCVVAALAHMSHFYYAMGTTLLIKSATMIVLGALLLGAAHQLRRAGAPSR